MIWVLGGTCDFRRARNWLKLKKHLELQGVRFVQDPAQAQDPFGEAPWLVVDHAEQLKDPESLQCENMVWIWHGKKPEKASWLQKIDKKHQTWQDNPPPWEQTAHAVEFVQQELVKHQQPSDLSIAQRIVARVGTDLGLLAREVDLLSLAGLEALDALLVTWGATPLEELVEALSRREARKVVQLLPRFGETMGVTRALATRFLPLLAASELEARGLSSDLIAEQTGQHPYRYRVAVQPIVEKLGFRRIRDLIHRLAVVERAVQTGQVAPRHLLVASLTEWCQ